MGCACQNLTLNHRPRVQTLSRSLCSNRLLPLSPLPSPLPPSLTFDSQVWWTQTQGGRRLDLIRLPRLVPPSLFFFLFPQVPDKKHNPFPPLVCIRLTRCIEEERVCQASRAIYYICATFLLSPLWLRGALSSLTSPTSRSTHTPWC